MGGIEQVLNYVKNITETLNQWAANAKKTEELPVMETMVPEGLLIVSELVGGIWTSKQLEIQKIIEGISLSGQDNTVREVLLGTITTDHDLNYLLDNIGITVTENEILVVTALATINATLVQKQYLWKLGKGDFNPIGSENVNSKLIELQPRFLNEITSDELTSSPSAIVYDFGVITDSILDVINTTNPPYNYTDDEKIYYIRFIKDEVKLLYNFIGINGTYGFGASQMTASDLVLVYSSANTDITELFNNKLDKDGYPGTAKTLDYRISAIEFPDIVLKSATPIIQGLNISVPADSFEWRINQIVFDNTPGLSRTLTAASNGFYRKDVLLGTNTNSFLIVEGAEGDESVTPPTIFPEGTILLGVIDIFGNTTTGFLINDTSKVTVFGNGGETDYVEVNKLGSTLDVRNATSLTGFTIPSANIQYGKDYYLRNSTGGNLTLKSLIGSNSIRFYFPDGDLVVPLNNNVHLKYLSNNEFGGLGYLTLVGISYNDKADKLTTYTKTEVDAKINNHFKSVYLTEAALFAAHPTASVGDYAQVNEVGATDVVNYNWDAEENIWVKNEVAGSGATNTDQLPEGASNLYFTVARFVSNLTYDRVIAALGFTPSTAPNNAQKNSEITKAEIEAKLTGEITSHTHPNSGGGDMTTTTNQTVSGIKTFLAGKLGFRNVANTFTSFFTNSNTASRTYTLQDRNGTLADLTDIAAKMNTPNGTVNYLSRFLTSTTIGLSRLFDNGTFFGIGTINAPTKDITLSNSGDKYIGIEQSNSLSEGKDLIIEAGRTINFLENSNFVPRNTGIKNYRGISMHNDTDIYYAVQGEGIYKQYNGVGALFNVMNQVSVWYGVSSTPSGNVYAIVYGGDIYMQTNGAGNFNPLGQTNRNWTNICADNNGNIYATTDGGDIYMQTNGAGNFNPLGQTNRTWYGITVANNGNVYATVYGGDIYMRTNGAGNFNPLGQTNRTWYAIKALNNNNIYVTVDNGDIYMQTNGIGSFAPLLQLNTNWTGLTSDSNSNVFACVRGVDTFYQQNFAEGYENLKGGTIKIKSGTGKGSGQSRVEFITGQKLPSGTGMQVETLREYIDENGYHIYISIPVYADNSSAIIGGLPIGCEYRTSTGVKMIVYQP